MLSGVPETALWTLYHRAIAARNGVLDDPKAIELVERIDHPFQERFGDGELAAWQGLRVRAFDNEIRRFITAHPDATVIALGEGLETQFWRVDNGRVRWVTVDLPESVALRRQLLPQTERQRLIAASALDTAAWIDTEPGLITAQGLLMYLDRDAVHGLLKGLPPAALLFDLVSKRLAAHSARPRKSGYQAPAWTFGADQRELDALPVEGLRRVPIPHGRGAVAGVLVPLLNRVLNPIGVYSARTIAASSSSTATPATTSTVASSANAARAVRDATRATRRDA
ncbi:class I SAM-dependent methyltransferase [Solirubrobacter ginsenosidimutans]|uniref:Class I SAM-dependent methyltransferase n=1 Tax=Solirubrobacter ginsenosidimutans TaxID=490573 RepID=A0A9X3N230_9ACTN|nr:class I SAM-dependent methyltransferase [Solirubrobacter ginsenosidimutans]MDA0167211.1 class I SAM-dependent methyltransferase [Solirubrobacter ginsenosidimutans]